MIPYSWYVGLAIIIFVIGVVGALVRRNVIVVFVSVELMLNAINLLLVTFSNMHNNLDGEVLALFIMAIAGVEVALGLAIITNLFKHKQTVNLDKISILKW
jgi:NADH-quinone oxidoreductase subunit K